jgi:hypothetical protein
MQKQSCKRKYKKLRVRDISYYVTDNIILIIQNYEKRMHITYPLCNIAARSYYYRCVSKNITMQPSWILFLYQFAILFFLPTELHQPHIGWQHLRQYVYPRDIHPFTSYINLQFHLFGTGLDWMLCVLS